MDTLRDYKNGLATAKKQGIALGKDLGRQEGVTLGKEEGIALTSRKIALSLKEMGMSIPDIIKATGLSAEEIKKL